MQGNFPSLKFGLGLARPQIRDSMGGALHLPQIKQNSLDGVKSLPWLYSDCIGEEVSSPSVLGGSASPLETISYCKCVISAVPSTERNETFGAVSPTQLYDEPVRGG